MSATEVTENGGSIFASPWNLVRLLTICLASWPSLFLFPLLYLWFTTYNLGYVKQHLQNGLSSNLLLQSSPEPFPTMRNSVNRFHKDVLPTSESQKSVQNLLDFLHQVQLIHFSLSFAYFISLSLCHAAFLLNIDPLRRIVLHQAQQSLNTSTALQFPESPPKASHNPTPIPSPPTPIKLS